MKKITSEHVVITLNGAEFRRRRRDAGKTLREIAADADLSISYLCDIELGRRLVKDEVAQRLIEALEAE